MQDAHEPDRTNSPVTVSALDALTRNIVHPAAVSLADACAAAFRLLKPDGAVGRIPVALGNYKTMSDEDVIAIRKTSAALEAALARTSGTTNQHESAPIYRIYAEESEARKVGFGYSEMPWKPELLTACENVLRWMHDYVDDGTAGMGAEMAELKRTVARAKGEEEQYDG